MSYQNSSYKPTRGQPYSSSDYRFNPLGIHPTNITSANINTSKNQFETNSDSNDESTCESCKNKITDDKQFYCDECDDYIGCSQCWADSDAFSCSKCKCYWCEPCHSVSHCDSCHELYCKDCGDFKPKKGGGEECHDCQSWWKKNKPASDFCVECGSARQHANFCDDCGKRFCYQCYKGLQCEECDIFKCEYCCDFNFCETCEKNICLDCECDCQDSNNSLIEPF